MTPILIVTPYHQSLIPHTSHMTPILIVTPYHQSLMPHTSHMTPILIVTPYHKYLIPHTSQIHNLTPNFSPGLELARALGCHYFECSSITQRNVKEIFDTAVKVAMDLEPRSMSSNSSCGAWLESCFSGARHKTWPTTIHWSAFTKSDCIYTM